MTTKYGLGRIHQPDARDLSFPAAAILPGQSGRTRRFWWEEGWEGDQGQTPECVAYAWVHLLADGPITHPAEAEPLLDPDELYRRAQAIDGFEGKHDGTSVRAGARVLHQAGALAEYRWAPVLSDAIMAVLEVAPAVVGCNWYESMFYPDADGFLTIADDAQIAGGHAFVLNGINVGAAATDGGSGYFRMKNSWGTGWGHDGTAKIGFRTMARLLAEQGELCLPIEARG